MTRFEQVIVAELDKVHEAGFGLDYTSYNLEVCSRLDSLALELMATRPDLEQASLDEWIVIHHEELSDDELRSASAIIDAYYD